MEAYRNFAQVYDLFMEDTPYDEWVEYLKSLWERYNHKPKLIADLGCGTGTITRILAKDGYDMIGIDLSEDMLAVAREKASEREQDILYLLQDMREFELYGTVDCIISLFDSINYITEKDDLFEVFKLVNNYLEPGGLFIFDVNTEYKFENILSSNTFAQTSEEAAYIWENFYDKEEKINEYYMNFFIKQHNGQAYERFEEFHYEKAYSIQEITFLLEKSGLKLLDVFDAFTFAKPKKDSQRLYFVAQEVKKKA
jgi:SAM-dependent methyltransferase